MIIIRLLPIIFTTLLIAAHFSRGEQDVLAVFILFVLFTLFIRKKFILRAWQVFLGICALVWITVAIEMIQLRINMDLPWTRLLMIMSAIILFSGFSAWWMENKKIKTFYGFKE